MDQAVRGRRPLYRSCRAAIERLNSKARFVYGRRAVILKRVILRRVILKRVILRLHHISHVPAAGAHCSAIDPELKFRRPMPI